MLNLVFLTNNQYLHLLFLFIYPFIFIHLLFICILLYRAHCKEYICYCILCLLSSTRFLYFFIFFVCFIAGACKLNLYIEKNLSFHSSVNTLLEACLKLANENISAYVFAKFVRSLLLSKNGLILIVQFS